MQTSPRERTFILYTHVLIFFVAALWKIKIDNIKIAAILFLVIFALLIGGILGLTAVKYFRLKQKNMGFMFTRGSIINIGSIGRLERIKGGESFLIYLQFRFN